MSNQLQRKQPQTLPVMYRLKAIEPDESYESPNHEDAPEDEAEDAASGELEDHRTLDFSCSSEAPVIRWFGEEILDHNAGSIDLSRFASRANILWNHNPDCPIGVIEKAWVQNKRLYVKARFSRNEKAREVLDDIRDGILTNVSIGYMCHEMRLEVERDTGDNTYRITRWTPMEVSIVTVPADYSVGIGRSAENREYPVTITRQNTADIVESIDPIVEFDVNAVEVKGETMTQEDIEKMVRSMLEAQSAPKDEPKNESKSVEDANQLLTQERERCANITALGEHMGNMELAQKLIESGATLGEANRQFLALQQSRTNDPKPLASPMVNTRLAPDRDQVAGALKEYEQVLERSFATTWTNRTSGAVIVQRYNTEGDRFLMQNREALRSEVEAHAKKHGLLRGDGNLNTRSSTAKADIPPLLLDYLSAFVRVTHIEQFVWWQFPSYNLELGKGPGDTIQVSRDRYLAAPAAVADRQLAPGTNLSSDRQNVAVNALPVVLKECGLGKNGVSGAEPVGIPQFISAYSMRSLEQIVQRVLGFDYQRWVDLSVRTKYAATSRVVYNDRGSVETVPANVGTGDDGTLSETFLNNLYAYMAGTLRIPTDETGCLYLVAPPIAVAQLKNSLAQRQRYIDRLSIAEMTNIMSSVTNYDMPTVTGYMGTYCNFHIFQSNAASVGSAGSEGVQTETLGVGATLTRSSYAFGVNAVTRAVGMDVQVRLGELRDFQRLDSYIWYSHEETASLDVDPAINAEQQLRVVAIRTVDIPV